MMRPHRNVRFLPVVVFVLGLGALGCSNDLVVSGDPSVDREAFFQKGTTVTVRNDTGGIFWYRWYQSFGNWSGYGTVRPGEQFSWGRQYPGDDVEFRLFTDLAAAEANDDVKSLDIDAENEAIGPPWVFFADRTEYFQSEGEEHTVQQTCVNQPNNKWWWKREADSSSSKHFTIHIKKLVVLDNGWHDTRGLEGC